MDNDDNIEELSEETLVVKSDGINDVCSSWSSSISSLNLGSINVAGTFAPLTENGIATGLIPSLAEAIKKLESSSQEISGTITSLVEEQQDIDTRGESDASNRTTFNTTGGGGTRGSNSTVETSYDETENNELVEDFKNENENVEMDDEEAIGAAASLEKLRTEFDNEITKLDDDSQIGFINDLINISGRSLSELLYDEKYSQYLKEKVLNSVYLTDDLKNIISQMDENEVQVCIKNMLTNGDAITDFSKIVLTVFESSLNSNTSDYLSSQKADELFSSLSNISEDKVQEGLSNLYMGNVDDSVSNEVIYFTRNYIDVLATAENTTSEDILSNSKYKEILDVCTKDLKKTFSYLKASNGLGQEVSKNLCSKLMIEES